VITFSPVKVNSLRLEVSENIGTVSAELIAPDSLQIIITLAHGAGAGMNHPFMTALANELAQLSIGTLRFNFPFTEQKKKRPDFPAVAHKTIEEAVKKAHELFPSKPLFVSGKSFGGRMSSQLLSKMRLDFVKGLIFYGFPLHAPGKLTIDRAEHLKEVTVPMLFIQGTRDELANWSLIEKVTDELSLATLRKIEGANHAFKSGKENLIPVIARTTKEWADKL
jgi:uncharacterized protein